MITAEPREQHTLVLEEEEAEADSVRREGVGADEPLSVQYAITKLELMARLGRVRPLS